MKNPEDFEKLEEEAARLAEQFPTVTAALLWVIGIVEEHHHKLDMLRDAIFHIGSDPNAVTNPEDLQNMMSFIQELAENAPAPSPSSNEEGITEDNVLPMVPKKDDDEPTVH